MHVTISGLGYDITEIKLVRGTEADMRAGREPLIYAKRAHLDIRWRELLHARLVAQLRLDEPKIVVNEEHATTPKPAGPKLAPDLSTQLEKITGLKVDRIDVVDGRLLFRAGGDGQYPQELWVHRLLQRAHQLAATGIPDDVTVQKLGLKVDGIFLTATPRAD